MFVGTEKRVVVSELQRMLIFLEALPIKFYLTGSRFFGTAELTSDFDFFTENDGDTERLLLDNGFLPSHKYKDSLTAQVLSSPLGIDVQLVNDVQLKVRAQKLIASLCKARTMPKNKFAAQTVWDSVIEALKNDLQPQ